VRGEQGKGADFVAIVGRAGPPSDIHRRYWSAAHFVRHQLFVGGLVEELAVSVIFRMKVNRPPPPPAGQIIGSDAGEYAIQGPSHCAGRSVEASDMREGSR